MYAFLWPVTPQPFQLPGPRFTPGRLLGAWGSLSLSVGVTFRGCPVGSGRPPVVRRSPANYFSGSGVVAWRRARPDTSSGARGRPAAHRFSPTGPVYLPNHSPGFVMILSGRKHAPASRAPRGKEQVHHSNVGAA